MNAFLELWSTPISTEHLFYVIAWAVGSMLFNMTIFFLPLAVMLILINGALMYKMLKYGGAAS